MTYVFNESIIQCLSWEAEARWSGVLTPFSAGPSWGEL